MKRDDLLRFARLAVKMAQRQVPDYASKFAPKRYTQPSLLACLCLKEYMKLDYRGMEALLVSAEGLREALGLRSAPDHSTLWWFSRHKVRPGLLDRVLTETLKLFHPCPEGGCRTVAVDSTGLERAQASRYYRWRAGKGQYARTYLKWSLVVWTRPLALCAQLADLGPKSDHVEFRPLVMQAAGRLPFQRLLADGGYDSEANHRWVREEVGAESIIPPVAGRPHQGGTSQPYRRQMQLAFPRQEYGQRWKAETVISVIKRRFGWVITARRYWQQIKQALLWGLCYNLHRAVQLGLMLHLPSHRMLHTLKVRFSTEQGLPIFSSHF